MKKPAPRWYIVETMAHKRAMARPMRPVHIRENAEAKAADYALWVAVRDNMMLDAMTWQRAEKFIAWDSCEAGERPRFVEFHHDGKSVGVVEIPHWNFIERPPVEMHDEAPREEQLSLI